MKPSHRILLLIAILMATALAGVQWIWATRSAAAVASDLRLLGLRETAVSALVAEIRGQQRLLLLGLAAVGIGIVAALWLAMNYWIYRPLAAVAAQGLRFIQGDFRQREPPSERSAQNELRRVISGLGTALADATARSGQETELRERAESALRASEERYALAVRCANDGLWEWDTRTDQVYYAPNWKALLGYQDNEIGCSRTEWLDRIHPDDQEMVATALQAHIAGETPGFECDHRLRHKDGSYRWFLVRGQAVRSANGKVYKLVGLNTDVTVRKRAEQILLGIARGLSEARGDSFFRMLVKNFAEVLGTRMAFICQCIDYPTTRVRMLGWWNEGAFVDNIDFELEGTPCNEVITKGELTFVPCGVEKLFPREVGQESYLGLPIFDHTGTVIGHLACFDTAPMQDDLPKLPIFTIFAVRAGIEIEQRMMREGIIGHA